MPYQGTPKKHPCVEKRRMTHVVEIGHQLRLWTSSDSCTFQDSSKSEQWVAICGKIAHSHCVGEWLILQQAAIAIGLHQQ